MKSILAVGCAILAVLADGASEEVVQGRNELGVLAVTTTTKNTIVPIAFTELSDGGEMKIADFVKTQNLKAGDQVMVFTDRGNYETWQLTGADGSNKTWEKMGSFSLDAEGKQSQSEGNEAADVTKAVGSGVWLILGDDRAASTPVTFYLNGKPVLSKTTETQAGKWNLLGNPNETGSFSGFTPVVGDQIAIPVDNGFRTYRCRVRAMGDDPQWFYETYKSENGTATATKVYEAPSVDAAKGLWYYTQDSQTINWNSNN